MRYDLELGARICDCCGGSGKDKPDCRTCGGHGSLSAATCPACDDAHCRECGGTGELE